MVILKKTLRLAKWYFISLISRGKSTKVVFVNPSDIVFGQLPHSQFPARDTYLFVKGGSWDTEILPVEEHLLYASYVSHFREGVAWECTPFYKMAINIIAGGASFRGEYGDENALQQRFEKCEQLYEEIRLNGYKSNRELYKENSIDNVLSLLDEVTVNIGRDGKLILNDGWHRFVSARLLGLASIPVRILVKHSEAPKYVCKYSK